MNDELPDSHVPKLPPDKLTSIDEGRTLRSLDERGVPRSLPVREWWHVLERLVESQRVTGGKWPHSLKGRLREMARTALRFTRPDGSLVFGPGGLVNERGRSLRTLAAILDDGGLATVARWWFGKARGSSQEGPPPLPTVGDLSRPIAVLRADWSKTGDLLAVDARDPMMTRVELTVCGQPIVGPAWPGPPGIGRMRHWITSSTADYAEWSVGTGAARITRTAILLRGRGIAILAEQRSTAGDGASSRIALSEGVATRPIANSRALMLKPASAGLQACAIPLALNPEGGGTWCEDSGVLSLTGPTHIGARVWLPILFSWDKDRIRKIVRWRMLTVSEKGKICPSDRAFAARVSWGSDESLVVYRSLTMPATRTFLGHQTTARLLIGIFSSEGNMKPLLKVE